jgi:hypothetical protein
MPERMLVWMRSGSISKVQTKVHYMIAADCTVVDDDVCKDDFHWLTFDRKEQTQAHPMPTEQLRSTKRCCVSARNLGVRRDRAGLFNFKSLL